MNKIVKKIASALLGSTLLLTTMVIPSADAASLSSFSMNTSSREFEVSTLTYSLGRASTDKYYAIASQFNNAIAAGESVQYFKFNYTPTGGTATMDYVSPGTFTYYINPARSSSVDEAVTKSKAATTVSPLTRIVKFYTVGTAVSAILEGPQVLSTNSSLNIGRYPDSTLWKATEKTANAANPVGQIKFAFSKNLNKTSADNIRIYLNGASTAPADEALIKGLLFGAFVDGDLEGTLANELSGDIFMTYSQLKNVLDIYNNDTAVTKVKIEGLATDNSWVSMTIDIL